MRYAILAAAVLAVACSSSNPDSNVQRLLDAHAPGLPLGGRVPQDAHARYELEVAPYEGYRARKFQGPDGVRELVVQVDRAPGDGKGATVSARARIQSVSVRSPNAAATAQIDRKVREVLGEPKVLCYTAAQGFRVETRYWPGDGGRGVLFLVFTDSLPSDIATYGMGWAIITFGTGPITGDHVKLEACP